MALQVSTKFKELILGANSFASIFNGGRILIYSGAQPTTADHAVQGTLLAQVTTDGDSWVQGGAGGLVFEQYGAWVTKAVSAAWRLKATVAGTAGWFRLVAEATDPGTLSYSHARIDGAIGAGGTAVQMVLEDPVLTSSTNIPVQQFSFTFPPVIGA